MIRVIYNFGEKYLTRLTLWRSKKFTLYLHIFHKPDPGRELHNHPWDWCWSMCLWGGYTEQLALFQEFTFYTLGEKLQYHDLCIVNVDRYGMLPRKFPGKTYHTVAALNRKRVVTLFAHGKQVREWGFWKDGKHVPWHEYLVDEGINTQEEIDALKARYGDE